jgi:Protein DA1
MDNIECQPLYMDIREFFEGLMMEVEQQIPLLLVERGTLNEAVEKEKARKATHLHSHMHTPNYLFS